MKAPPRAACLLAALLLATPIAPHAQQLPPAADAVPDAGEFALERDDPPARVGRIARLTGPAAELRLPEETEFRPARLNEPLLGGQAVATPPGGRAELDFGATRLFLDGDSAIEFQAVPEAGLRAALGRGAVLARLSGAAETGETAEIVLPDATVTLPRDGRVLIEAGGAGRPTRIAVFEGVAEIATPGENFRLSRGEAVRLAEGEPARREPAGVGSGLVAWASGAAPRRAPPVAARGMTGADDLGVYGGWQTDAQYGDVWYPREVGANWVPFSDGSWEWRDPWGWTWIDAAPWGFATSHYGRWVRVGPRWGWAPAPIRFAGPRLRPVFAPAVVAFFGGVRGGFGGRPVGWVPLGPREAYFPWFRASPGFVQRANVRVVVNVRDVRNVWVDRSRLLDRDDGRRDGIPGVRAGGLDNFVNRRGATVVPEETLRRSQPVAAVARRPGPNEGGRAEPLAGPGLRPGVETGGVTPRIAERLGLRDERGAGDGRARPGEARDPAAGPAGGAPVGRAGAERDGAAPGPAGERRRAEPAQGERLRGDAAEPRRGDASPRPPAAGREPSPDADANRQRSDAAERRPADARPGAEAAQRAAGERRRAEDAQRAQADGERRRAEAAQREAGERQRAAAAQRDAAQRQRAEEAGRQRAVEQQRQAQQERAAQQQRQAQQERQQQQAQQERAAQQQRAQQEGAAQQQRQAQQERAAQQQQQERAAGAQRQQERAAQRQQERGERQR